MAKRRPTISTVPLLKNQMPLVFIQIIHNRAKKMHQVWSVDPMVDKLEYLFNRNLMVEGKRSDIHLSRSAKESLCKAITIFQ